MKMVVLEIKGDFAAALSDDGSISKIPNQDYSIGQVLFQIPAASKTQRRTPAYFKGILAAAAVFVFILSGSFVLNTLPFTYVSLDVNPSLEYSLNIFNKVVDVKPMNADAQEIIDELDLKKMYAKEAVTETVLCMNTKGYFKADTKSGIVISASGMDQQKSQNLLKELAKSTVETTKSSGIKAQVFAVPSSMDDLHKANKLGTTPGKFQMAKNLASATDPKENDEEMNNLLNNISTQELVNSYLNANQTDDDDEQPVVVSGKDDPEPNPPKQTSPKLDPSKPATRPSSSKPQKPTGSNSSDDDTKEDQDDDDEPSEPSESEDDIESDELDEMDPSTIPPVNPDLDDEDEEEEEDDGKDNAVSTPVVSPDESSSESVSDPSSEESSSAPSGSSDPAASSSSSAPSSSSDPAVSSSSAPSGSSDPAVSSSSTPSSSSNPAVSSSSTPSSSSNPAASSSSVSSSGTAIK